MKKLLLTISILIISFGLSAQTVVSGNKVFEKDNIKSDKIEFKKGNLPKGVYLIELKGEKVFRGKMVVK